MSRKKKVFFLALPVGLTALLLSTWFLVKSEFFLKRVVVPRIARSMDADISLEHISLHPFSRLELSGLSIRQANQTDISVQHAVAEYSLVSLLKKSPEISRVAIEGANIQVVIPDGKNSREKEKESPDEKSGGSSAAMQVDIRNISVANTRLRVQFPGENGDYLQIESLSFKIPEIKNGKSANLQVEPFILKASIPDGQTASGKMSFSAQAQLGQDLLPKQANITLQGRELNGSWEALTMDDGNLKFVVDAAPATANGNIPVQATLSIDGAKARDPNLSAPVAVGLSAMVSLGMQPQGEYVIVEQASLTTSGGIDPIEITIDGPLKQPLESITADQMLATFTQSEKPRIAVSIPRLNLAALAAPLPRHFGLTGLQGVLSVQGSVIPGGDNILEANIKGSGKDLHFPEQLGQTPYPLDVEFETRSHLHRGGNVSVDTLFFTLGKANEAPEAIIRGNGQWEGGQKKDIRFSLSADDELNVEALLALLPTPPAGKETPPQTEKKRPEPADGLPPIPADLSVDGSITAPKITYGTYVLENIQLALQIKDGILRIPQSSLSFWETPVEMSAEWDSRTAGKSRLNANLKLGDTPLGEIISRLKPGLPVIFRGGLKSATVSASTFGAPEDFLQNLDARADMDIGHWSMTKMPAWANTLADGILKYFHLTRNDLRFNGGKGQLSFKSSKLVLEDVFLDAALWRLNIAGNIPMAGTPDVTFVPAFRSKPAQQLKDEGMLLEEAPGDFHKAPPLRLYGSIWNPRRALTAVPALIMNYAADLGVADPEFKAANQGVDIIRKTIENPGSIKEDPGAILGGAFDIFQQIEQDKEEEKDRDRERRKARREKQAREEKTEPAASNPAKNHPQQKSNGPSVPEKRMDKVDGKADNGPTRHAPEPSSPDLLLGKWVHKRNSDIYVIVTTTSLTLNSKSGREVWQIAEGDNLVTGLVVTRGKKKRKAKATVKFNEMIFRLGERRWVLRR